MNKWVDYFEALQIHPLADAEVIEAAYKRLAKKYHPDVNKDSNAETRMKLINEAYSVLKDPVKREIYYSEWLNIQNFNAQKEAEPYKPNEDISDNDIIAHPWRRYFSRMIDFYIGGTIILTLWALVSPYTYFYFIGIGSDYIKAAVSLIIYLTAESIMLSLFGTTPAKWAFGLQVKSAEGHKPSLSNSFKRNFWLLYHGLAFHMPILILITMYNSYIRLKRSGTTIWDLKAKSRTIYNKPQPFAIALLLITIASFIFIQYVDPSIPVNFSDTYKARESEWKSIKSTKGMFEAKFPHEPEISTENVAVSEEVTAQVERYFSLDNRTQIQYLIEFMRYPDGYLENQNHDEFFDTITESYIRNIGKGAKVISNKKTFICPYPNKELVIKDRYNAAIILVSIIRNNHLYFVVAYEPNGDQYNDNVKIFFDSFKLIEI